MTAAISTGGVYQTTDGGASWSAAQPGHPGRFLPEGQQFPEFGQCVHKVARHPSRPERLFLQNHGGVYRSDDEGATWQSIAEGLPPTSASRSSFTRTSPTPSSSSRWTGARGVGRSPEGVARVWCSRDAGRLDPLGDGLPDGLYAAGCATRCASTPTTRPGSTSARVPAAVWASFDSG